MHQPKMKDLEEMKAHYEAHGPAFDRLNQASDCTCDSKSEQQAYVNNVVFDRLNSASDCTYASNSEQQAYVEEAKATVVSLQKQLEEAKAIIVRLGKQLDDEKSIKSRLGKQLDDEEATNYSLVKQLQDEEPTTISLEEQLQDEEPTKVSLGKQLQDEKSPTVGLEKQAQDVASSNAITTQIERAPHPFCFSGDSIDWREFKLKMRFKMQLDGHLYPTANDRLTYVMTRLKTEAFDEVCSFFKDDGTISIPDKPHADFTDVLQVLENAFDPPPRSRTTDERTRRARGRGRNSHRRQYPSDIPNCPPM
ncbi:hypothetical protein BKA80DRAFT_315052 [Phyllosticta citrichinensis]